MIFLTRIKNILNKGDKRGIQYKKNAIWMLILKGISICISFLYVPLLINTLDVENYGIWITLTSIVSWIGMMDIGLGNGLRNKLAASLAEGNHTLARRYVSSAYVALFAYILIFMTIFFIFIFRNVSWNNILNAPNIPKSELDTLVFIIFISFGFQFVLNLINSILLALQKPSSSSLLMTIGQLLSFISVLICVKVFNIRSLIILGSIVSLSPVIVLFISSIILFRTKYRYLSPCIRFYDNSVVKDTLKLGVVFFVIQIMTIVQYQSNNIIITHVVGNESVVEYNIAYKYFQIIYMLYMIIVTPMWSATTQAYVTKDFEWIKNTKKKLSRIAFVLSIMGFIMLLISPIIYSLWIGEQVSIMFGTSLLLFLSEVFRMFYGFYGYIINGIGKLRAQLVISGILTILYVPLTIILGNTYGLIGILCMNLLVNIVNFIWAKYQYTLLIEERATGFWSK